MSDHLSGPRAMVDPSIDLTDLYAFPSPSGRGRLVLVMNVFPNARPGALFSDAASYRFRLRPAAIPAGGTGSLFDIGVKEYASACTFSAPVGTTGQFTQRGTCALPNREAVSFQVNDEYGDHGHGVHIYAALRLDPFFMDVRQEVETRAIGRLAFLPKGTNSLDSLDVLTIVVQLDVATVLGPALGSMLAVAAETMTVGPYPLRLERLGRPEMKNILLSDNGVDTANTVVDLRDLYNQEDPFRLGPSYLSAYRARLNANLAFHVLGRIDDAERAASLAEAFVEQAPHDPRSLLARARVSAFFHRFSEALADLDAAAALGLDRRCLNAERATIFQAVGRYEEALALHNDALSSRRDFDALGGLAGYYAVHGEVAEADAWFLAARRAYRDVSPFPLAVLEFQCGQMWLAQDELVRARTWLKSAVRRLPAYVLAQGHLAAIDAAEASTPARAVST